MRKILADSLDWRAVEVRLEAILRSASSSQWHGGLRWYPQANHLAQTLVCFSELSCSQGAGIIAALSPQASWERNIEQATALCSGSQISNTQDRLDKAYSILGGADPDEVLKGKKERAFWLSISEPLECRSACIDRHMVRAALNVHSDELIRLWIGRARVYERIATLVARIADRFSIPVPACQAIIWLVVRDARQTTPTSKG
jgi:hypothetical protein